MNVLLKETLSLRKFLIAGRIYTRLALSLGKSLPKLQADAGPGASPESSNLTLSSVHTRSQLAKGRFLQHQRCALSLKTRIVSVEPLL